MRICRVLIPIAGFVALLLAWKFLPIAVWLETTCEFVDGWGMWGIAVFFCVYTGLTLVAFPQTPLNIAAGILFGLGIGFSVAMAAGSLGSYLCFITARYWAHDWFARQIESINGRWIVDAVNRGGFNVMLLARLNPFLPSSLKDYGFGLTSAAGWKFLLATLIGQAPIMLMYVYLGWTGAVTLNAEAELGMWQYVLIAGGVCISVALATILAFYSRREIALAT
ncbi:MAG TPA: VTT domain-containing protein [Pirellulaceae bacterium]|nr:VTT domain-containing protein [Pirellulaceae bacterium]